MSKSNKVSLEEKEVLEIEMRVLSAAYRSLDIEIRSLEEAEHVNSILLQKLKRRRSALKHKIDRISDRLFPDIIA